jgi:drug/metabolite transporter (DMT)-like permease
VKTVKETKAGIKIDKPVNQLNKNFNSEITTSTVIETSKSGSGTVKKLTAFAIFMTLVLVAIFSGDQISRKILLSDVTPLWSGALSYSLATIVLWVYISIKGEHSLPVGSAWRKHLISAILFLLVNVVGLYGVQNTLASRAGIFVFTYPLFVAVFGSLGSKGEAVSARGWIGMILAFAGVAYVLQDKMTGSGASLFGDSLILLSACFLGMLIVHVRDVSREYGSNPAILWQLTLSLPFLWIAALFLESAPSSISSGSYMALMYQAIGINVIGFLGRAMMIEKYNASQISSFFFLTPVLAVLFGYLLLDDPLTTGIFAGGLIVGIGVLLTMQSGRKKAKPDPSIQN